MLKVRSLVVGSIAALAASGIAAMPAAAAGLTARGSIGQAYVLGAEASQSVSLLNSRGKVVGAGTTGAFGQHDTAGNYALSDGSVQQTTASGLTTQMKQAAGSIGRDNIIMVFPR